MEGQQMNDDRERIRPSPDADWVYKDEMIPPVCARYNCYMMVERQGLECGNHCSYECSCKCHRGGWGR